MFVLEALVVGIFLKRGNKNPIIVDGLFWILFSPPLVLFLYKFVLGVSSASTLLILLSFSSTVTT